MKARCCVVFLFAGIVVNTSNAAIIHLTREGHARNGDSQRLVNSEFGRRTYGEMQSYFDGFTMTVDTVQDTGSITAAEFSVEARGGGTETRTFTTVIPPANFPDPPTFTTRTYSETVTIDSISPIGFAPQFLSSSVGSISYVAGFTYRFPTTVTLAFPDSFRLRGTYMFQSPERTDTIPFDVLYTRSPSGGATEVSNLNGFIDVGTNFPETAQPGLFINAIRTYIPTTRTIYTGTADGRTFNVSLLNVPIFVGIAVPEPASLTVWPVCLCVLWGTIARRIKGGRESIPGAVALEACRHTF